MKLIIASDIHGSSYYCDLLVKIFNKENPDKLILLGDILYHGPRNDLPYNYAPKSVIEMLNNISDKIICIRGNCDAEVDQMVLNFPLSDTYKKIIVDGNSFVLTHGHIYNEIKFDVIDGDRVMLNGHTHIPLYNELNGFVLINPGSVSIPKANSPHSFILYNDGNFYWKNLETNETYLEYKL